MPAPISRAAFLKSLAGLGAATLAGRLSFDWWKNANSVAHIPCRMLGPSFAKGHRLRTEQLKEPDAITRLPPRKVTIVGGGIAGLSAAWWLEKHGFTDFILLELEKEVGGNSSQGKNNISAYPWGAHYIPLANSESLYTHQLFEELKIIQGFDSTKKLPIYNELYLCHEPQERLFKDGVFQDGLVPKRGLQPQDKLEIERFFQSMHNYKMLKGSDNKPAFAIPLALSSQDKTITALDRISMMEWLKQNNFSSKALLWYVNYCCRDDYGATPEHVSAWAGIHYFAGRRGYAANAQANSVVTWPEGNGFIVDQLKQKLAKHIRAEAMVNNIHSSLNGTTTRFQNIQTQESFSIESDYVIFAAPRFIAKHVLKDDCASQPQTHLQYAPWLVANISLRKKPDENPAWDNVSYYSASLGYVVATHQNLTARESKTVITYYYPLSDQPAKTARTQLLETTAETWLKIVVEDLEKMHPGIRNDIISADFWPWGHGMISPSVGFIWGEDRKKMGKRSGKIIYAHSDMSGISNFEEAQFQGVEAAKAALSGLGFV